MDSLIKLDEVIAFADEEEVSGEENLEEEKEEDEDEEEEEETVDDLGDVKDEY